MAEELKSITGQIKSISPIVLEGNTHYYICLENSDDIFDLDMQDKSLIQIVKYQVGDRIVFEYLNEYGINQVKSIK